MLRTSSRWTSSALQVAGVSGSTASLPLRAYGTAAADLPEQDVVVIGGGPGGYVAAIKGAQLGLKVTCVEKRGTLGGTCLNVGCIPSKNLLHTSHLYDLTKKFLPDHGVLVGETSIDVSKMMASKEKTVTSLTSGIEMLFKANKVNYVKGHGAIASKNSVSVNLTGGGQQVIKTKNIVLATGSDVMSLPFLPLDEKKVVSSTGALSLAAVPKHLIVVGGGVIGLELGSVWKRLGADVTVIEFLDVIGGAGMDVSTGEKFMSILKRQKMKFKLGTKVVGADLAGSGVVLHTENVKTGAKESIEGDVCLVSIGRRKYVDNLGLETVGLKAERGNIAINDNFQTAVPNIYAIGDIVRGPMLAHKAEEEGISVMEHIAGHPFVMHYDCIPSVVYTNPEVAWVGATEEDLKAKNIKYKAGVFPMAANSRAKTNGSTDGQVKVLADAATDRILGVHIIAEGAGEMIAECVMGMTFGASSEDIARTCHAHPTCMEAVKEAAMAAHGKPIHSM